jgi:antitoxin YefM
MRAMSISSFRKTLAATLDKVAADREPVIVTREGDKAGAVILSVEDYNSMAETIYLLRSPRNAAELLASIAEVEGGRSQVRDLID